MPGATIESTDRKLKSPAAAVALAMVLYHMVSTQVLLQGTVEHNTTHLGFALVLVFLTILEERPKRTRRIYPAVLILFSLAAVGYIRLF
jgi:TRAP-type uncharacterized transport system fused permease subunit